MRFLIALLNLSLVGTAMAGTHLLPNCYSYAKISEPTRAPNIELFVIIDQTTPLDSALQQAVANNIKPFLQAGNAFSIMQFSAFTQGHYTDVIASERLYGSIETHARDDIGKVQLNRFDQCMTIQSSNAAKVAGAALKQVFNTSTSEIAKSDIFASLKDISAKVRQSTAQQKVVFIVSDMLENSSISSFYANHAVRKISPEKEQQLVEDSHLYADFSGARTYVLGAGLLAEDAKSVKGIYRDPKTMAALQQFWQLYFKKSNSQLIEFGQPALLNPVR